MPFLIRLLFVRQNEHRTIKVTVATTFPIKFKNGEAFTSFPACENALAIVLITTPDSHSVTLLSKCQLSQFVCFWNLLYVTHQGTLTMVLLACQPHAFPDACIYIRRGVTSTNVSARASAIRLSRIKYLISRGLY